MTIEIIIGATAILVTMVTCAVPVVITISAAKMERRDQRAEEREERLIASIKEIDAKHRAEMQRLEENFSRSLSGMGHQFETVVNRIADLVERMREVEFECAIQLKEMQSELRQVVKHERMSSLEYRVTTLEDKVEQLEEAVPAPFQPKQDGRVLLK